MRPAWLKRGSCVRRKPAGYVCRIVDVDDTQQRALVRDVHVGKSFWVGFATLEKTWLAL